MERLALFLSRSDLFLSVSPEEGQEIAQALMELGPGVDLFDVGGDLPPELEVRNLLALWWVVLSIPDHTHEANLARESLETSGSFYARFCKAFSSLPRQQLQGDPFRPEAASNTLWGLLDALTWLVRCITLPNSFTLVASFLGLNESVDEILDMLGYGALAAILTCKPPLSGRQQAEILRALSELAPRLREDEHNGCLDLLPLGLRMRAYSTCLFLSLYKEPNEGSTVPPVVTDAFQYYASPNNLCAVFKILSKMPHQLRGRMMGIIIVKGLRLIPYSSRLDRLYQQDFASVLALGQLFGCLPAADVLTMVGRTDLTNGILSQNLAFVLLQRDPSSPFHGLFEMLVEDVIRNAHASAESVLCLATFVTYDSKFRFHFADRVRSDPALFDPFAKALLRTSLHPPKVSRMNTAARVLLNALGMASSAGLESYFLFMEAEVGTYFSKLLPNGARMNSSLALSSCYDLQYFSGDVDLEYTIGLETSILRAVPLIRRYLGWCEGGSEPPPTLLLLQALTNLVRSLGGILRAKQRLLLDDLCKDLRNVRRLEKAAAVAAGGRGAKARDMRLQVFRERSRVAEARSQLEKVGQAAGEVRSLCGQLRLLGQEAMREIYLGGI